MDLREVRSAAKEYGLGRLHLETGVARSRLYEFVDGADLTADNLTKVLSCLGFVLKVVRLTDIESLDESLAAYGAPLPKSATNPKLTQEEALLGALRAISVDPTYFDFVVYLLVKRDFDYTNLLESVALEKDRRLLGFAADLARKLVPNKLDLDMLVRGLKMPLKSNLKSNVVFIGRLKNKPGKFAKMHDQLTRNQLAEAWNVSTSTTLEMLMARFEKWDRMAES